MYSEDRKGYTGLLVLNPHLPSCSERCSELEAARRTSENSTHMRLQRVEASTKGYKALYLTPNVKHERSVGIPNDGEKARKDSSQC